MLKTYSMKHHKEERQDPHRPSRARIGKQNPVSVFGDSYIEGQDGTMALKVKKTETIKLKVDASI